MIETGIRESVVEQAALAWLEARGWRIAHGPDLGPDSGASERTSYGDAILEQRVRDAIGRLNPTLPSDASAEALRRLTHPDGATLEARNRSAHLMLTAGVDVEYRDQHGEIRGTPARLVEFDDPEANDWLAVNQFTLAQDHHVRRPDIVLFLNGLPVAIIELKNPADEDATIWTAHRQVQTYIRQIPSLFTTNAVVLVSDGVQARVGTLTAGREWFKPWRTVDGDKLADAHTPQLQVALEGIFDRRRFLELLRDFIVFERNVDGPLVKKVAGYHQFHAVQVAVDETLRATDPVTAGVSRDDRGGYTARAESPGRPGDRRVGVVWHTQGSGKSLTMAFYAGRIAREPAMANPTVVVLTDRNDLDDQLFGTFARCQDLLRQQPVQATSRAHLRELLSVATGGVVFTTIQKFFPDDSSDEHPRLSDRSNIVVLADEAHRSQYDFIDGFARHMRDALPHASFIAFTGTPIEAADASTRAVFGDYISVYDIQRAVEDGATVPIYYESRLAKLGLDEAARPRLDPDFEEATEGEEVEHRERLKSRWAQLEAIVGAERRLELIAKDIVRHFEQRLEVLDGKAMIVCMSRRICVDLYWQLTQLRPEWHHDSDDAGAIKVVMTGSAADPVDWQLHIRSKGRRASLAQRFRDPSDPFKIVLVRDMWLTGFDAPSLHTMYVDKPMRGHGLMQAIARVNRVFRDKPGGLVVDYLGIAHELKQALATYTEAGGTGRTAIDQAEAVEVVREKHEVCATLFHGFHWSAWTAGTPQERLGLLPAAQEHILAQNDGKDRLTRTVRDLTRAFALAVPHPDVLALRNDIAFFQAVQSVLAKRAPGDNGRPPDVDQALRQLVSEAITPDHVVDIFAAAGLKKPDVSILSDEFLAEVREMPQRNLAVEMLQKLLDGEVRKRRRRNLVQSRSFAQMLEQSLRSYHNRAIETAQVIEELLALAKRMREADRRGERLGLTEEELAFYDALETNDSAVAVMGDEIIRAIAQELVRTVRENVRIDWTVREDVRAHLRVLVKRILRRHGYPPDKQERATRTVLEQAELMSEAWAAA